MKFFILWELQTSNRGANMVCSILIRTQLPKIWFTAHIWLYGFYFLKDYFVPLSLTLGASCAHGKKHSYFSNCGKSIQTFTFYSFHFIINLFFISMKEMRVSYLNSDFKTYDCRSEILYRFSALRFLVLWPRLRKGALSSVIDSLCPWKTPLLWSRGPSIKNSLHVPSGTYTWCNICLRKIALYMYVHCTS